MNLLKRGTVCKCLVANIEDRGGENYLFYPLVSFECSVGNTLNPVTADILGDYNIVYISSFGKKRNRVILVVLFAINTENTAGAAVCNLIAEMNGAQGFYKISVNYATAVITLQRGEAGCILGSLCYRNNLIVMTEGRKYLVLKWQATFKTVP